MERYPLEESRDPEDDEPGREVVGEIVGHETPPAWCKRLLARASVSLALGVLGAITSLAGVVLIITIVGAAIGLPVLLIGLLLMMTGLLLFFGGGPEA